MRGDRGAYGGMRGATEGVHQDSDTISIGIRLWDQRARCCRGPEFGFQTGERGLPSALGAPADAISIFLGHFTHKNAK